MMVSPARRRERILMVCENGLYPEHLGGMEIRARELVASLQDTYDIALLTKRSLTSPDGSTVRLHIPRLVSAGRAWRGGRILRSVGNLPLVQAGRKRLNKSLSTLQPDLLYLHRFKSLHPVVVHDLLHSGRPVLSWFGDQHAAMLASFATGSWVRRVALRIGPLPPHARDRVTLVFNCEYLRQFYAPLVLGYANQFVIYDGVDPRRFHPAATPLDTARFAFLGRVDWGKGFLDFCRAMTLLPRAFIGGIEIIGDGPQLREGLQLLRLGGRSDLVGEAGPARRETVPDRLRTASVVVHPSAEEGMPASVLEAMACGLAVVATAVGGTPEAVRHGETGLLVAPGDFGALVAACRMLAENAELRRRLGANARALVAAQYDAAMSFAATKRLIAETISRGGIIGRSPESSHAQLGGLGEISQFGTAAVCARAPAPDAAEDGFRAVNNSARWCVPISRAARASRHSS
jgi:glycosyltransferase involved in cell wall biosynthesis